MARRAGSGRSKGEERSTGPVDNPTGSTAASAPETNVQRPSSEAANPSASGTSSVRQAVSVSTPAEGQSGHYTVVARRYRPKQFSDLIGQEHVAQALVQALQSGRVAHAYLFTGARGVGKTSTARILAKALNCARGPTPYPCDECDICKAIATGEDVDVLEIDGASNRGIEDARDLRYSVGFRPARARFKIFIIDEVHMLTREAFNALLKTLEEPPPHVKFIFATTEVQKIPVTILSRCQRFDFAHVRPAQISCHLQRIVQQEGREADTEALQLIARKAAGSMRDAQSLLDQLLAAESGKLTVERVRQVLGLSGEEQVLQLAEAIFRRDAATALQLLSQWYDQGLQAGELLEQLIQHWRNLMLIKCAGPAIRELPIETTVIETVRRQTEQVSLDTILAGLDVWTAAKARLRDAYQAQVLLEMAVVRLARMDELLSVGALWQHLTQGSIMAVPTAGPASPPTPADSTSGGVSRLSTPAGSGSPPSSATAPGTVKKNSDARPNATSPIGQRVIPLSPGTVAEVWAECLRRLEERFRILANHLKQAMPPQLSGANTLVVRFAAPYNSAYEACSGNEEFARRLEETVRMVTGQPVQIRYERVPLPPAASREASPSGGVATPSAQPVASTTTSTGSPGSGDPRRHWLERPLFRKAAETLGAQIIRVDEGFQPQEPSTRMDSLAANTGTDEDNESINTAYTSNDEN